jgi:hypothetical protein
MATDAFDTPPPLAAALIQLASSEAPSVVADFAAGTGELLLAAETRWPGANYVAIDLDAARVETLRGEHPGWAIRRVDFTSQEDLGVLNQWRSGVDLVLLNPPFSCRGGRRHEVETRDGKITCSLAMAFVLLALPFLAEGGEVLAILPRGCVDSDKDAEARNYLSRSVGFSVLQEHGRGTFPQCTPRTVVVRVGGHSGAPPGEKFVSGPPESAYAAQGPPLRIYRGRLPRHKASTAIAESGSKGLRYIHTTDLGGGEINPDAPRVVVTGSDEARLAVRGPAVLLPRVGRPQIDKVVLHSTSERLVLSDCVIALLCDSAERAIAVHAKLREGWAQVERMYGGTCARYTTLRNLRRVIHELGYPSDIVRRGESPRPQLVAGSETQGRTMHDLSLELRGEFEALMSVVTHPEGGSPGERV